MILASDGNLYLAGHIQEYYTTQEDILVMQLDLDGNILWQQKYAGSGMDFSVGLQELSDGSLLVGGYSWSFSAAYPDLFLLNLDTNGDLLWQRGYYGYEYETGGLVGQLGGDEFLVCGNTQSYGVQQYVEAKKDIWLLKTTGQGYCPPLDYDTAFVQETATSMVVTDTSFIPVDISLGEVVTSATVYAADQYTVEQQAP